MTPEQLDEIEKLAAEAPLGEWPEDELWGGEDGFCAQGPYHNCPHGGHRTQRAIDACNEVLSAHAVADQRFMQKATEYALPLVKAVREAQALLQSVARVCRGAKEPDQADLSVLGNVLRERDEARAEIAERDEHYFKAMEQYRLEVEDYRRRMGTLIDQLAKEEADAHQFAKERDQYQVWMLAANDELKKVRKVLAEANELRMELTKERNEARAEAARWKEHLRHIAYEHCDSPVHYAMNQLEE